MRNAIRTRLAALPAQSADLSLVRAASRRDRDDQRHTVGDTRREERA
jgi:hypothetical protein